LILIILILAIFKKNYETHKISPRHNENNYIFKINKHTQVSLNSECRWTKKKKTSIRKFEEKKLDIEASRLLLEDRRYQDAKLMEEKRFALEEKRFGLEGKRVEGETIRFELEKIRTYSAILETAIAGAALLLGIAVVGSSGCTVFIY